MSDPLSRRDFVERLGAAGAIWMVGAVHADQAAGHDRPGGHRQPQQRLRVLTRAEAREVDAIAARILPTVNGVGAKEAGVLYFIDRGLATFAKAMRGGMRDGLADLANRVAAKHPGTPRFSDLSPADQDALLHEIEETPFFANVRAATIAGMLSLPEYGGNRAYIGWKAIGLSPAPVYAPPFGYYDRTDVRRRLSSREDE